jgi:hypothetical protein
MGHPFCRVGCPFSAVGYPFPAVEVRFAVWDILFGLWDIHSRLWDALFGVGDIPLPQWKSALGWGTSFLPCGTPFPGCGTPFSGWGTSFSSRVTSLERGKCPSPVREEGDREKGSARPAGAVFRGRKNIFAKMKKKDCQGAGFFSTRIADDTEADGGLGFPGPTRLAERRKPKPRSKASSPTTPASPCRMTPNPCDGTHRDLPGMVKIWCGMEWRLQTTKTPLRKWLK